MFPAERFWMSAAARVFFCQPCRLNGPSMDSNPAQQALASPKEKSRSRPPRWILLPGNTRGLISALDVTARNRSTHFVASLSGTCVRWRSVAADRDADSYAARIAGRQWSYLRWCGHISVFSQSGLQKLLQTHGFEVLTWQRCEHPSSPGALAWWRVHMLEPARRVLGRSKSWYPFWRDHQMLVARLK